MTYVENRTGGDAAKHLARRMRPDAPNRFQTTLEMLTKFLHLAGEARVPDTEWKEELNDKLSYTLMRMVPDKYINTTTFQEFSAYCSQVAHMLKKSNTIEAWGRKPGPAAKSTADAPKRPTLSQAN